jgi:hypothetical protein
MTHPEDLLADYVDGTLGNDERAVVDAHLASCAACREDVELARSAVAALATLEERPVPLGVTGPVLAEAGRRFERRRRVAWQRVQWAVGGAAAAALVLVVALNLGGGGEPADRAGDEGGGASAPAAAGEAATLQAEDVPLELQRGVSYDEAGVRSLAEETASGGQEAALAGETGAAADQVRTARPNGARQCLATSEAPLRDANHQLVRLIEAEFDGQPAYFAVFLQSPGAGQPADHVVVWVTSAEDCTRILHAASLPI